MKNLIIIDNNPKSYRLYPFVLSKAWRLEELAK